MKVKVKVTSIFRYAKWKNTIEISLYVNRSFALQTFGRRKNPQNLVTANLWYSVLAQL